MKFRSIKLGSWFNSQWSVSIIGTMIGVLSAFFLNDWRESSQNQRETELRVAKIYTELENNGNRIESNYGSLRSFTSVLKEINNFSQFESSPETLAEILKESDWIYVKDSTALSSGMHSYSFGINLDMPNQAEISDFAWTLSQSSDTFTSLEFDCLFALQSTYAMQGLLKTELHKLQQWSLGFNRTEYPERFLKRTTDLIVAYETILLELYQYQLDQPCK